MNMPPQIQAIIDKIKIPKIPFSFGSQDTLGVDLGSSSIKVVQLKGSVGRYSLVRWAVLPLENVGADIPPAEKKAEYGRILKKYVLSQKGIPRSAVFSVSGNSVIVRYVKFPKMTASDLSKAIPIEAEPYIPFSLAEVQIGFHILSDVMDEGQSKMETIVVAAKRDVISDRMDIIREAGLKPIIIDVDAFALENAYDATHPSVAMAETVLIVNMGAAVTNVAIVEAGISKVVRDVFIAGNTLSKTIQKNFQSDHKTTEELKRKAHLILSPEEKEKAMAAGEKEELQLSAVILPVMRDLLSEVQRSLDFYFAQGADRQIQKVFLSGGLVGIPGLAEYYSRELHLPVERYDPFLGVQGGENVDENLRPCLAVSLGLATRRRGDG